MKSNLKTLADEFGHIKAQLAELESRANSVRAEIIACGEDAIEGELFRVTVNMTTRLTLDMAAVRRKLEELKVPHQWFSANTKATEITTVKCSARIGEAA